MSGLGDALAYVGSSIDKPGRAVRGLLGGKPREALAAIPFSDTLGITNPNDRVSGRNLTDAIGLTRHGDQGWGSHALGFAAEMATDPLAMLPVGHAAHAMAKAGHFDGLGSALGRFGAEELGAAKIPAGYGLSRSPKAAQAARQAYGSPLGHGIEAPASAGAYRMKPGRAPVSRPLRPMPHEIDPILPEVGPRELGEGGDFITRTDAPPPGSMPQYANADEMLDAYYRRQAEQQAAHAPAPSIEEAYAPPPGESDMRFAGDAHRAAQQGVALHTIASLGDAIRSPEVGRLLSRFFH